jgi:hypothetical protein
MVVVANTYRVGKVISGEQAGACEKAPACSWYSEDIMADL